MNKQVREDADYDKELEHKLLRLFCDHFGDNDDDLMTTSQFETVASVFGNILMNMFLAWDDPRSQCKNFNASMLAECTRRAAAKKKYAVPAKECH